MVFEGVHGRQISIAAKSILAPLGCKRIGRSRTWIADQRFWAVLIEFQPSSFSKGSYLNVGASWLWYAKPYWSFDYGNRIEKFAPFVNERQFAGVAEKLATRAAEEVRILRNKFASISDIARYIAPDAHARYWPLYHAAVAAGLAGDVAASERFLNRLIEDFPAAEWQAKLRIDSAALARTLPDIVRFRGAILAIVQESRALHGLAPDPTCLDPA
jgi:hypothetical protein